MWTCDIGVHYEVTAIDISVFLCSYCVCMQVCTHVCVCMCLYVQVVHGSISFLLRPVVLQGAY